VTSQEPVSSAPWASSRGTGVNAAAHDMRAASAARSTVLPAGAHFTNRRRSPVPTSKVTPSSFAHTGRTGAVPASAATGAGTGRPGGGGPESITGAGTGEPGTPESMCLRWHGRQTARHAISGPAAGHEGATARRAGWSAKLAVVSARIVGN